MDESIISRPIINSSLARSLTTAGKYHERMSECVLMTQSVCTPTATAMSEWLASCSTGALNKLWRVRQSEDAGNVSHLMWPNCHKVGWEGTNVRVSAMKGTSLGEQGSLWGFNLLSTSAVNPAGDVRMRQVRYLILFSLSDYVILWNIWQERCMSQTVSLKDCGTSSNVFLLLLFSANLKRLHFSVLKDHRCRSLQCKNICFEYFKRAVLVMYCRNNQTGVCDFKFLTTLWAQYQLLFTGYWVYN